MVINTMELAIMRNEFAQSRIWATLSMSVTGLISPAVGSSSGHGVRPVET